MLKSKPKKRSYLKNIVLSLLLLFLFYGAKSGGGDDDIYTRINKNMDVFGHVYKEIALNYVDEVDVEKFMKAGIEGMLTTLDPYTNFLDESRKDEIDLLTTGKYAGVGITIGLKDSFVVITEVMEGYSAQREGLRRGDKILEIDGITITGKKIGDVRTFVRGPAGTQLKMKVLRGTQDFEFVLTRQEINLKNVTYRGVIGEGIGYIKLDRFNKYAENEIVEAVFEIKLKGEVKGIILDLRDNPGGLLDASVGILDKFIDKGNLLVSTRGRKPESEKKYFSVEEPLIKSDVPLVLLVNENTASASEILAGAVQDLDRGIILGTKTFGKGLVQVYTPLSYGNQLKITNQKYFTPSGRWIQLKNYFSENKYGVFKPNPYYDRTEFSTLNGRKVYAEGGISPDTLVTERESNELLDELSSQDFYYRYAEKYVYEHPDGSGFAMNEDIIGNFYGFLSEQDFQYSSKAETELGHLKNLVAESRYSDKTRNLVSELEEELKAERLRDFERSKPEMKVRLGEEIMRKYNRTEKEIKDAQLQDDIQLQAAIGLIMNPEAYKSLLVGTR